MTSTPDTDMHTALHSTLHPILAQLVERKLSRDILSLTVSQFAEFYPALQERLSIKDWEYVEVASMVFSRINPPIPFTMPMPPFGAMRGCAGWHAAAKNPTLIGLPGEAEADLLSQGSFRVKEKLYYFDRRGRSRWSNGSLLKITLGEDFADSVAEDWWALCDEGLDSIGFTLGRAQEYTYFG
ncbi:hypothetical protein EV421DRAFT_1738080 [Armillaria borealis]|uniref:Uncharacterized protein n=1 Tax=Armillaria borealis TaxID=47425 RepID=A0AA39MLZ6_9AGAR|nr:hypothetical protein EV421DRAFT_1738080 [Armillaria borealis]